MHIGIIGSGHVGQALGLGLALSGHQIWLGSREPLHAKHDGWQKEAGASGSVVSYAEAARRGQLLIAAVPWAYTLDTLAALDPAAVKEKTVIDVTNAVAFGNPPRLLLDDASAGERIQRLLPESRVVKTLNTVKDRLMVRPRFQEGTPVMFMSGDHDEAKRQTRALLNDLGWTDIVDLGDIRQSRIQEAVMLACLIGEIQGELSGAALALLKH